MDADARAAEGMDAAKRHAEANGWRAALVGGVWWVSKVTPETVYMYRLTDYAAALEQRGAGKLTAQDAP